MGWMGLLGGLALAWFIGEVFGWHGGGLVVLGGVMGWLVSRLHQRVGDGEAQVKALREELAALRDAPAPMSPTASPPSRAAQAVAPVAAPVPLDMPAPLAFQPLPSRTGPAPLAMAATLSPIDGDSTAAGEWAPGAASGTGPSTAPTTLPEPAVRPLENDERSVGVTTSLGATLRAWFTGGNTIVRVAVLILFIGVAFLLRYAAERTTVPIELRLAGVALAGVALVALGRRLLRKRRGYGLSLQGTGIGIVYLTLFAAFRLYGLLPAGLAFGLLAALAAVTAVLAVGQNALPLAVLGFGGAFLAPVLTSTGQGSHVALFGYCLLLNLAIAWIAQRQAWKLLNLVGFLFTFTLGGAWGAKAYEPAHFWTTEPFLVLHFLLYLFIAVQYTRQVLGRTDAGEHGAGPLPAVDGSLLFGVPIVAFGLQAAMLKDQPLALAASAAVMSALYLAVGRWLWRQAGKQVLLLVEGLLALGVIFLALVVPLALDARWTAAAWAIQGVGVLWVGLRQQRWWAAGMGLLLQGGAAVTFWGGVSVRPGWAPSPVAPATWPGVPEAFTPFLNSDFFGAAVLAAAALVSARLLLAKARACQPGVKPSAVQDALPSLHLAMMASGMVQLWWGGWVDLAAWAAAARPRIDTASLAAGWSALLLAGLELSHRKLQWPELRWAARGLLMLALLASTAGLLDHFGSVPASWARLVHGLGWLEASALTLLGLWLHRRLRPQDQDGPPADPLLPLEAVPLAWYAMLQSGASLYTLCAHLVARHEGWTPAAAILPPTLIALALMQRASSRRWPVGEANLPLYRAAVFRPWLGLLGLWVLAVNAATDAGMAPLPYLPLLNPVDLAHGLVLLFALRLGQLSPRDATRGAAARWIGGALAFWWLNSALIRTLHHWAGTPLWWQGALGSALVQTSLTVLWTLSALAVMLHATRRAGPARARPLWMLGAALLGVVVLKLFLVDLASVGTLQRIVSFLAVGGLMLVIGYVSPMPPAAASAVKKSGNDASKEGNNP